MFRKPQSLFPSKIYPNIYTALFPNLSFKDLTRLAEDGSLEEDLRTRAERTIKKKHASYANLKGAYFRRDFVTLIDNLVARVLPFFDESRQFTIYPKTESTYKRLLTEVGPFLGYLIGSHLFSNSVHNEPDPVSVHDLVFHYCRYSPQGAGELLNKNILKLWSPGNRYLVNYLIQYGAQVNAVYRGSQSTLFHIVTFNSSAELIRMLIEHGASYAGYGETRHGVRYTLMLIAALNRNLEALPVLVEKFPGEVAATLETLDQMISKNSDTEFTSEHGAYKPYTADGQPLQPFYTVNDIRLAKEMMLQLISEKGQNQEAKAEAKEGAAPIHACSGNQGGHQARLFPGPSVTQQGNAAAKAAATCEMDLGL